MVTKKCSIENCNNKHSARGYCGMHYNLLKKQGKLLTLPRPENWGKHKCSIENCKEKHYRMEFCLTHYGEHYTKKRKDKIKSQQNCAFHSCSKPPYAQGYCSTHYPWAIREEIIKPNTRNPLTKLTIKDGSEISVYEAARIANVTIGTIYNRINKKWPIDWILGGKPQILRRMGNSAENGRIKNYSSKYTCYVSGWNFDAKYCEYCGDPRECWDHVVPVSFINSLPENLLTSYDLIKVPACTECNMIASDHIFQNLPQKRGYIFSRLEAKYYTLLKMPNWTNSEVETLDGITKIDVKHFALLSKSLKKRIDFAKSLQSSE